MEGRAPGVTMTVRRLRNRPDRPADPLDGLPGGL